MFVLVPKHIMAVKLLDEALAKIDLLLARFSLPDSETTQAVPTAAAPAKAPAGMHLHSKIHFQVHPYEDLRNVAAV